MVTTETAIATLARGLAATLRAPGAIADPDLTNELCALGKRWRRDNGGSRMRHVRLFHDRHQHGGLLWLPRGQATPIHDHAGSATFSLLLDGHARVELFTRLHCRGGAAVIRDGEILHPATAEGVWLRPHGERTLHRVAGTDDGALLLDFQFPPIDHRRRLFFFTQRRIASSMRACRVLTEWELMNAATTISAASGVTENA